MIRHVRSARSCEIENTVAEDEEGMRDSDLRDRVGPVSAARVPVDRQTVSHPARSHALRVGATLLAMDRTDTATTTADSLARERCVEIRAGTPPLTAEEVRALAGIVSSEWRIDEAEIHREFTFRTFNAAFGLATRVALLAEAQGHHPELEVGWGRLIVRLSTHSVGGLSRNDFIMAARIDRLAPG
jgi:4a-hydroxytetrahydrobiopterin dehydratase